MYFERDSSTIEKTPNDWLLLIYLNIDPKYFNKN
jgi:hypothetical protein